VIVDVIEGIPDALRQAARPLGDCGVNNVAWAFDEAVEVLRCLDATCTAMLGGDVYVELAGSLTPTYDNWFCDRESRESNDEYARRSRDVAIAWILRYPRNASRPPYFAFVRAESAGATRAKPSARRWSPRLDLPILPQTSREPIRAMGDRDGCTDHVASRSRRAWPSPLACARRHVAKAG
jgi:hypothetical protein